MSNAALQFDLRLEAWQQHVAMLNDIVLDGANKVVRQELKLLTAQIIKFTPPTFTKQFRADMRQSQIDAGSSTTDRALGERKVRIDLFTMFRTFSREFLEATISKYGNPFTRFFTNSKGEVEKLENVQALMTFAEVKNYHRMRWRGGNGRVSRRMRPAVPSDVFAEFVAYELKQVGSMKGGWATAANVLGLNVQQWVGRHNRIGAVTVNELDNKNPAFYFVNRAKDIVKMRPIVSSALKARGESIRKNVHRLMYYGNAKSNVYSVKSF